MPPSRSAPRSRASRTSSPAASVSVRACWSARLRCAPPACCSRAAWCAGIIACACRQRHQRCRRQCGGDRRRAAQFPEAGWEIRNRSNASPQLERNVERFTQFLTIVGLTALLVGGVGVGNAVKSHLDRRRDVIATLEGARRVGPARVRDLSHAGAAAGAGRRRHRRAAGRERCRSCIVVDLRRDHSVADRYRPCIRASLRWRCSTACSRRSLSRSGRSAARMTSRSAHCSATQSRRSRAGRATIYRRAHGDRRAGPGLRLAVAARLRPPRRDHLRRRRRRRVRLLLRLVATLLMAVARRRRARARPRCAWPSPISTGPAR